MDVEDFDKIVDLELGGVDDACFWLLGALGSENKLEHPYRLPYTRYVMTWKDALPLKAIVMAQSPYPNPIYSETAAAMSYNEEKCMRIMKRAAPPTVSVLANDLYINAGVDKNVTIAAIRDGWRMVSCGVLLVNVSVFESTNSGESFSECVDQVNVLCKLLRETEKSGNCTVDLIAYGMGAIMASELTKCFKSDVVRLRKFTSDHPAHLSYKFGDLSHPLCHLGAPSTSKALAGHIRNYVANLHTMPPVSEERLQLQRLKGLFNQYVASGDGVISVIKETEASYERMLEVGCYQTEEQQNAVRQHISTLNRLSYRMSVQMSLIASTDSVNNTQGIYPARPGPSLPIASPSQSSIFNRDNFSTSASATQPSSPQPQQKPQPRPAPITFQTFGLGDDSDTEQEKEMEKKKEKKEEKTQPQTPVEKKEKSKRKLLKKKRKDGTVEVVGVIKEDGTKEMFPSKRLSTIQESPRVEEFPKEHLTKGKAPETVDTIKSGEGDVKERGEFAQGTDYIEDFNLSTCAVNNLSCIGEVLEEMTDDGVLSENHLKIVDRIGEDRIKRVATYDLTKRLAIEIDKELGGQTEEDLFDICSADNKHRDESGVWKACRAAYSRGLSTDA